MIKKLNENKSETCEQCKTLKPDCIAQLNGNKSGMFVEMICAECRKKRNMTNFADLNKAEKAIAITGIIFAVLIALSLALTPLWVWIDNGKSIYGGINDTPLSFGLAFIGTALSTGILNIGGSNA